MSRSGNLRVTQWVGCSRESVEMLRVYFPVLTGLDRLGARRRLKLRSVRSLGSLVARIVGTPEDGRTQCNRQRSLRRRRRLASSGWRTGRHLPTEPTTHQLCRSCEGSLPRFHEERTRPGYSFLDLVAMVEVEKRRPGRRGRRRRGRRRTWWWREGCGGGTGAEEGK